MRNENEHESSQGSTMPFRVSGKNMDVGEALRERISGRMRDATAKYFDGGFSGHVTVGKEGSDTARNA